MVTNVTQLWVTLGIFRKTDMSKAKDYYTVNEFAEEYGTSTDRVYEWLRSGHIKSLPRVTPHSIWRIPQNELARLKGEPAEVTKLSIARAKIEHIEQIRLLLLDWRRDIRLYNEARRRGVGAPIFPVTVEQMFPFVLEHCPSIKEKYEELKRFDLMYFIKLGTSMISDMWEFAEEAFKASGLKIEAKVIEDTSSHIKDQLYGNQVLEYIPFNVDYISDNDAFFEAQKAIFSKFDADERVQKKRKLTSYFNHLVDALDEAIEISLQSHEYRSHNCSWCPT